MTNLLKTFYKPFIKSVESGEKEIKRDEFTVLGKSDFLCPECGRKMVKKLGKYGIFLSCIDFPKCKGMRSIDGKTEEDRKKDLQIEQNSEYFVKTYLPAPKTKDGIDMILTIGRYGKFWVHPEYPKKKEVAPLLLHERCIICNKPLIERKGRWGKPFIGCSGYPDCKFIKKIKS